MFNLGKTQKGSILDIFLATVMLISIITGILIVYTVFNAFHTGMQGAGFSPTALQPSTSALTAIVNWNSLVLFIYIGVSLGCVISAFAVRTHPIYFLGFIIIQVLLLAITPIFQSVWLEIATNPGLTNAVVQFPFFGLIMNNLPMLAFVLSLLVAFAMFLFPGG